MIADYDLGVEKNRKTHAPWVGLSTFSLSPSLCLNVKGFSTLFFTAVPPYIPRPKGGGFRALVVKTLEF
jgi:hypothetical protein